MALVSPRAGRRRGYAATPSAGSQAHQGDARHPTRAEYTWRPRSRPSPYMRTRRMDMLALQVRDSVGLLVPAHLGEPILFGTERHAIARDVRHRAGGNIEVLPKAENPLPDPEVRLGPRGFDVGWWGGAGRRNRGGRPEQPVHSADLVAGDIVDIHPVCKLGEIAINPGCHCPFVVP